MKKWLLLFWGIIIVLLISCNKPKEQPNNTITIDQINMDAFAINKNYTEPVEEIVEIFILDSINMISDDGSYIPWDIRDNPPSYLPKKGTLIKLINRTILDYRYISYSVKIFEDSSIPFYEIEESIGGAITINTKFYYTDNNIVMHIEYEGFLLNGITGLESEEEKESISQNRINEIFDAIFVKVIEEDDLSKQDTEH